MSGRRIVSKFNGQCYECKRKWSKGDLLYFDGDNLHPKTGKKITCSNDECFFEQGGKINPDEIIDVEDLTFKGPRFNINKDIKNKFDRLDPIIDVAVIKANEKVQSYYPLLGSRTNIYGMIRNAFMDKYLQLYILEENKLLKEKSDES